MPRLRQPKKAEPNKDGLFEQEPVLSPEEEAAIKAKEEENKDIKEEETDTTPPKEKEKGPPAEDETTVALKQRIADLEKAEETARQQAADAIQAREEALRKASANDSDLTRYQQEIFQSQLDAIESGLAAAKAEAEKAQLDIENSLSIGDGKGQADAYRRLARAESNITRLEDGKLELESKKKEFEAKPSPEENKPQPDALANSDLPDTAKTWLRKHSEYLTDRRKNAKIQSLHWDVLDEGHEAFSPEYFDSLEEHLGMKQPPEEKKSSDNQGHRYGAPPSRNVPSGDGKPRNDGKITLTPEQKEAAKLSGITEVEYARQLKKYGEAKEAGHYGERR